MNIFRLQLMAELLKEMSEAIPTLEMTSCTSRDWNPEDELVRVIDSFSLDDWTTVFGWTDTKKDHCGYSACAVGHAMFDVRFNALGLYHSGATPAYEGKTGWEAVQNFFGISERTATTLFSPGSYATKEILDEDGDYEDEVSIATPEDVLERVQFLLKHGEHDLNSQFD